ncbi:MAG: hypothetical protein JRH01_19925 [Deltaproteobacteria bacterium]|nr:hypothetical protein [Deltaproteobacteria bacterium]
MTERRPTRGRAGGGLGALAVLLALAPAKAGTPIPGNVVINRLSTANGIPAVVFPHWKHRVEFRCYACHPDPFEMRAGANEINMSQLSAGAFCGACHDGSTAFAVSFDTCRTCHSNAEQ